MNNFLLNNHHNKFINNRNYDINICKDCTKSKKEFIEIITDNKPCDIINLGFIGIKCNMAPIIITTPIMVCPFGFNSKTQALTLQFTNVKSDPEMNSFYNFIQELELEQMHFIGLNEENADLYLTQIRNDKEGKYDPNLLIKVPFKNNSYEVDIKHKDSSISIKNIYKFSRLKCDIYIDRIWKFNDKYVCKWKVKKILVL